MRNNHEIDYKIYGEELQFVEVELDPGETVIGEPGGFMMMDGIEMQTIFGDGSAAALGYYGGEGFIMEKLDGDGLAFVHAGGYIVEKEFAAGEIRWSTPAA